MYRTISKVNARSLEYRKRLTLMISVAVTLVIASIWAITLPNRLGWNNDTSQLATSSEVELQRAPSSPFTLFKESIVNSAEFAFKRGNAAALLSNENQDQLGNAAIGDTTFESFTDVSKIEAAFNETTRLEFLPKQELKFLPGN